MYQIRTEIILQVLQSMTKEFNNEAYDIKNVAWDIIDLKVEDRGNPISKLSPCTLVRQFPGVSHRYYKHFDLFNFFFQAMLFQSSAKRL